MKIAFIGQKGIPARSGGIETHVEEMATRMARLGHEVYVYVRNNYTDKSLQKYKNVYLIHLPSITSKKLDAISHTFLATIDALFGNYDVVHYHGIGPTSLSWIIRLLKRKTVVIATYHCQDYFHQKWGWDAQMYLRFGEYVTCTVPHKTISVSEVLAEFAKKNYNADTVVIPNGADVTYNPNVDQILRWGLRDKRYILFVGRLVKHKGAHYLIEAFKQLEDSSKLPNNMKLVIVGEGSFTDDYVNYLHTISEGRDNIIFTGAQHGEALEQLFSHAYLFVQPSETEGLSIALLEAMGYGLCTLVSDIPENLEAVGKNGLNFQGKNIDDLKEKLAYIINRADEALKLGKLAKEMNETQYSWDSIALQTISVYNEAIEKKRA